MKVMQTLLIALMILLNLGGVFSVVLNFGRGDPRWLSDVLFVVIFDIVGFSLLRSLREDG